MAKKPAQKSKSRRGKQHAQPKRGYKKGDATVSRSLVITVVLVVGASAWALYSLNKVEINSGQGQTVENELAIVEKSSRATGNERSNNNDETDSGEPEYDFYSMLKDFKVIIRDDGTYSSEREEDQNYNYLIQAGSFKTAEQAERRRAELILLGLEPTVDHSINSKGEPWYRVRLGPYTSRRDMAAARTTIISNGMDAMVMKRKQTG